MVKSKSVHKVGVTKVVVKIERVKDLNFDVQKDEVHDRDSMKNLMRKESKRNYQEYSCLALFLLVDECILSDDTSRDQLVEHFTGHWSLVGKPKLLFVLGGRQLDFSTKETVDNANESIPDRLFRIPKYADFMFFHSELVSSTIRLLCSIFSNKSAQQDLMTMLSNLKLIQSTNQTINSTLTCLISFASSECLEIQDENFQLSNETLFLSNDNGNCGKCLIFNYTTFLDPSLKERSGTEKDLEALESVFGDLLKFTVDVMNDLSVRETRDVLCKEYQTNYSQVECFVICFLSHGNDNGVLHCKDGSINKNELVNSLVLNASLDGKPKLLFIQACQGSNIDPGILVSNTRTDVSQEIALYSQPDLFVFSSSYPGHYSYRDSNGSWFIQSLCEVLQKHHSQYDLTTIATIVCQRVAYRSDCEGQQLKQIPFFHSTFTRPIAFVTCYPLK